MTQVRWMTSLMYVLALASMALVGLISPLTIRLAADLGAPTAAIGLTIALFSLPAAIVATVGGGIVDRVGPRLVLLLSPLLIAAADLVLMLAPNIWVFDAGMVLVGIGYVCVVIGAPAMIIAALEGPARTRVMAFWPTYPPIGFALGLLAAVPFTGTLNLRLSFAAHGVLMLVLAALLAGALPRLDDRRAASRSRGGPAQLFAILRDVSALRLAVATSLPAMISYGTSLVAPTYIANVHGVSLAASATAVAIAKIVALLLGGTITGALLARNVAPARLFVLVALLGAIAQLVLYLPASPFALAIAGLMGWLFAYSAASGVCMALMTTLSPDGARGGAVAGLVNQGISIGSFLTPTIYFAFSGWQHFFLAAVAGLALSVALLPRARQALA